MFKNTILKASFWSQFLKNSNGPKAFSLLGNAADGNDSFISTNKFMPKIEEIQGYINTPFRL